MQVTFNEHSAVVLGRYPPCVASTIAGWQSRIENFVHSVCASARATSGFRDAEYNRIVSTSQPGHEFSLHLCGAARDYSCVGIDVGALSLAAESSGLFTVVNEPGVCVHVQLKRP